MKKPYFMAILGTAAIFALSSIGFLIAGIVTKPKITVDAATGPMFSSYKVKQVSAGAGFSMALMEDGTLWAWGSNSSGQLGLGYYYPEFVEVPTRVGTGTYKFVSCGTSFTMAIATDDILWAWGLNNYGQLGVGDTTNRNAPTQISGGFKFKTVSCGSYFTMAIASSAGTDDGRLLAWGRNDKGQLGDGTNTDRNIVGWVGTAKYNTVSCGGGFTMAISTDSTLWAWGDNESGQLGLGNTSNRNTPAPVGTAKYNTVSCGNNFTMAIATNGTLWACGNNFYGSLGLGDSGYEISDFYSTNRNTLTQVGTATYNTVSCGDSLTMAIATNGTLWAWGQNSNGRIGFGYTSVTVKTPTQLGTATYTASSCVGHTLAIDSEGSLWTWGRVNANSEDNNTPRLVIQSIVIFIDKNIDSLETAIDGINSDISDQATQLETLRGQYAALAALIGETGGSTVMALITNLGASITALEGRVTENTNRINALRDELDPLKTDFETLQGEFETLTGADGRIEVTENAIAEIRNLINGEGNEESITAKIEELTADLENYVTLESLSDEIADDITMAINGLKYGDIAGLDARLDAIEGANGLLAGVKSELQSQITAINTQLTGKGGINDQLADINKELADFATTETTDFLEDMIGEVDARLLLVEQAVADMSGFAKEIADLKNTVNQLGTANSNMQDNFDNIKSDLEKEIERLEGIIAAQNQDNEIRNTSNSTQFYIISGILAGVSLMALGTSLILYFKKSKANAAD